MPAPAHDRDRGGALRDEELRAAEEVAPRPVGGGLDETETTAVSEPGAVDENRPADIVGQAGLSELTAPRMQPNVLQHPYAIGTGVSRHADTAGQELAEDEE